MKRVLVIQTAFLGDAILGTALLERIHSDFPDCRVDYLVRKGNESLFVGHPFLHEVLVFDKSRKFSELRRLIGRIRANRYDLVLNAQRFASSGLMTTLSGAGRTVGYASNPLSFLFSKKVTHRLGPAFQGVHEVDRLLDLYSDGNSSSKGKPMLYPSDADVSVAEGVIQKPFITVAPASVWMTKQWPIDKWVEFIRQVPETLDVHLIGAPADAALCNRIASDCHRPVSIRCGKLTLLQTAALMQRAVMNYANDSAPVHLASAVNAPMCEVYCSTVPEFGFTPLSDTAHIIEVEEKLDCRPCGLHGHRACPKGHFKCATGIDAQRLVGVLPT